MLDTVRPRLWCDSSLFRAVDTVASQHFSRQIWVERSYFYYQEVWCNSYLLIYGSICDQVSILDTLGYWKVQITDDCTYTFIWQVFVGVTCLVLTSRVVCRKIELGLACFPVNLEFDLSINLYYQSHRRCWVTVTAVKFICNRGSPQSPQSVFWDHFLFLINDCHSMSLNGKWQCQLHSLISLEWPLRA